MKKIFLAAAFFLVALACAPHKGPAISAEPAVPQEKPLSTGAEGVMRPPASEVYSPPKGLWERESHLRSALSQEARARLEANGFVIVPTDWKDIFAVYDDITRLEDDRDQPTMGGPDEERGPVFITTDLVFHAMHVLFDYSLRAIEIEHLLPEAETLTSRMLDNSFKQYESANGESKKAAMLNIAYFYVAASLLGLEMDLKLPKDVSKKAGEELDLIEKAEGFSSSPLFEVKEDYSQYKPRGHYTRNPDFQRYFRAMMWYGRIPFFNQPADAGGDPETMTRCALLQAQALVSDTHALRLWNDIYGITAFFVGEADDLTPAEYHDLAKKLYGDAFKPSDLNDPDKLKVFRDEAGKLRKPRVLSTISYISGVGQDVSIPVSYRFMGQRFIPDAYMMQELIVGRMGGWIGDKPAFTTVITEMGPARGFSTGLDVMSVMGSGLAEEIISQRRDDQYEGYQEKIETLRGFWRSVPQDEREKTLYARWLTMLELLVTDTAAPPLVRKRAWFTKSLNSSLGSWAEARHDVILYAKQPYGAKVEFMPPPRQKPILGYVEPYPDVWLAAGSLTAGLAAALDERGWLPEVRVNLRFFENFMLRLAGISRMEISGQSLSGEDHRFLWELPGRLSSLTHFSWELMERITDPEEDARGAVIADVLTDPNSGQCLEEAVGDPGWLLVAVEIDGAVYIAEGATFTYYEFKQPMSNRLTDSQWQGMLAGQKKPEMPAWASALFAK
jgi:hypothetical protein